MSPGQRPASDEASSRAQTAGDDIGAYAILETVASRAFTITYRARHRALGRIVLIETLKPTVAASSPFAAELEREAVALGKLEHEAIVRLYDYVRTPDAIRLVLEDVRGVRLAELASRGPLDPDRAAAIGLSIARGLAHAHERGVVHLALSPAAIVLTAGGGVKLMDFGCPEIDGATSRPDYLAPEQLLGDSAGARSDVWALGVILHELVAGARPFDAPDRRDVAPRIRAGTQALLPESVPRSLAGVIGRCLARAPEDRYDDARPLALALETALAARTRLAPNVLVAKALAAAKLGEEIGAREGHEARSMPARGPDVGRAARELGVVFALILGGGAALHAAHDDDTTADAPAPSEAAAPAAGSRDKGSLRVVATPWADVYVDGDLIDTTPIGRPILVPPGKHFVTFRHPSAPAEQRSIKIAAGQSVLLDVSMRIDRGDAGAKRDAAPVDDSP